MLEIRAAHWAALETKRRRTRRPTKRRAASSGQAISAVRFARSMTIRCANPCRTISATCSGNSARAVDRISLDMLSEAARRFAALPTAAKLLLILTAALLPIGIGLVWAASQGIRDANNVLRAQAEEQAHLATQRRREPDRPQRAGAPNRRQWADRRRRDLPAPTSSSRWRLPRPSLSEFELEDANGQRLCEVGTVPDTRALPLVAPGDIALAHSAWRGDACLPCGRHRRNGDRHFRRRSTAPVRARRRSERRRPDASAMATNETADRCTASARRIGVKVSMTRWPVANGSGSK